MTTLGPQLETHRKRYGRMPSVSTTDLEYGSEESYLHLKQKRHIKSILAGFLIYFNEKLLERYPL